MTFNSNEYIIYGISIITVLILLLLSIINLIWIAQNIKYIRESIKHRFYLEFIEFMNTHKKTIYNLKFYTQTSKLYDNAMRKNVRNILRQKTKLKI